MPKRYEFHSKLSPEEIFVRIAARTGWDHSKWGGTLYRKWIEYGKTGNSGFFLDVVGERGINLRKRKTHLFEGTVEEQGEGSVIRGNASDCCHSGIFKWLFLLLLGDMLWKGLLMGWALEDFISEVILAGVAVTVMWLAWYMWYDTLKNRVLSFIEENLLE